MGVLVRAVLAVASLAGGRRSRRRAARQPRHRADPPAPRLPPPGRAGAVDVLPGRPPTV